MCNIIIYIIIHFLARKMPQTKEQRLIKQRLCKRRRYNEIKNDPELLAIEKERQRIKYLKRKEEKKIVQIKDKTPRGQREQRKRWKENTRRYREKRKALNKEIKIETIQIEAPVEEKVTDGTDEAAKSEDPLQHSHGFLL